MQCRRQSRHLTSNVVYDLIERQSRDSDSLHCPEGDQSASILHSSISEDPTGNRSSHILPPASSAQPSAAQPFSASLEPVFGPVAHQQQVEAPTNHSAQPSAAQPSSSTPHSPIDSAKHPAVQPLDSQPGLVDSLIAFSISGQSPEVSHACTTDVSHQRPTPPSSGIHQAAVRPCTPGVRHNVDTSSKSSSGLPETSTCVSDSSTISPTHISSPVGRNLRCSDDVCHFKPTEATTSPCSPSNRRTSAESSLAISTHQVVQGQPTSQLRPRSSPMDLLQSSVKPSSPGVRHNVDTSLKPRSSLPAPLDCVAASVAHHPSSSAFFSPATDCLVELDHPGTSPRLELSAALDRLKKKVYFQEKPFDENSANPFQFLQENNSDDEDCANSVASYDSDEGRFVLGYQSADDRSMGNPKAQCTPSGIKVNKRHPNIPLNVRLRARKSSHPSTP